MARCAAVAFSVYLLLATAKSFQTRLARRAGSSVTWLRALLVEVDSDADADDTFWQGKDRLIYNEKALKDTFIPTSTEREDSAGAIEDGSSSSSSSSSSGRLRNARRSFSTARVSAPMPPTQERRSSSSSTSTTSTTSTTTTSTSTTSPSGKRKVLPFFDVDTVGATGRWINKDGNFLLLPVGKDGVEVIQPTGVIHFLGGAFVGAAPHLTYRYLLESLSAAGFIIVATPYRLDFDYLRSCDEILAKFDAVAVDLASEYGPLPVIGLGHSCGALLQTLITSLFPDAPRAINVLISFNNRPVFDAIPAFEELVVPVSEQIMGEGERSRRLRDALQDVRGAFDAAVDAFADSQLAPAFFGQEIVPLFRQAVEIVDQVPPVLRQIAEGTRDFTPSPTDTKEVCRRMYRARRTLLIKFDDDSLDESDEIEKVLKGTMGLIRPCPLPSLLTFFLPLQRPTRSCA